MKFQKGDIVRFIEGKVDWEVTWSPCEGKVWLKSGMSGRHKLAYENYLKPWKPHD